MLQVDFQVDEWFKRKDELKFEIGLVFHPPSPF